MKKLFLTMAVALGVFSAASAQGNMWVGGTVGLWSSKEKGGDSELSFKVAPEFGYILNDNIGLGISIGAAHTHNTGSTQFDGDALTADYSTNSYIVNPFLRYTFLKSDLGGLFFDGGVSYGWDKGTSGGLKGNSLQVGLRPGVAVNVSSKVALTGKFGFLGYQNNKQDRYTGTNAETATRETSSFGLDLDMRNFEFGVSYKF